MSRIPASREASPAMRRLVWVLWAANAALLALALAQGGLEVRDGSGSVTNGWIVAGGIVLTALLALGLRVLPFDDRVIKQAQALTLGMQALHAGGHLFRVYYEFRPYDDVLHFAGVLGVGLVVLSLTRSPRFLFTRRLGPWRVSALVWVVSVAVAGLWEIFEFAMDVILGTREQDDLADTMIDMIDGAVGGFVASMLAWREVGLERRAKQLADARSDELLD